MLLPLHFSTLFDAAPAHAYLLLIARTGPFVRQVRDLAGVVLPSPVCFIRTSRMARLEPLRQTLAGEVRRRHLHVHTLTLMNDK